MIIIAKTLLISTIILSNNCYGQSKSTDIIFYYSRCDSCKADLTRKSDTKFDYNTQYFNLKYSIIEMALDKALKNGDKRVVAISGVGILFPGLEIDDRMGKAKYKKHIDKYGYKTIWGTSDVIDPSKPLIQMVAYEYAKKYNTLLFKEIDRQIKK